MEQEGKSSNPTFDSENEIIQTAGKSVESNLARGSINIVSYFLLVYGNCVIYTAMYFDSHIYKARGFRIV